MLLIDHGADSKPRPLKAGQRLMGEIQYRRPKEMSRALDIEMAWSIHAPAPAPAPAEADGGGGSGGDGDDDGDGDGGEAGHDDEDEEDSKGSGNKEVKKQIWFMR